MDTDEAQALDLHRYGAARLQPGQRDPARLGMREALADENRVAVPADRHLGGGEAHQLEIALGGDEIGRQGGGAVAEAQIRLLQRHDVCPEAADHLEHAPGVAAAIGAAALAKVVAGDPNG